jgi:hypothetical protein
MEFGVTSTIATAPSQQSPSFRTEFIKGGANPGRLVKSLPLTFIILLPYIVFSAIFFLFDKLCPFLKTARAHPLGHLSDAAAADGLLLCPAKKPLLDMFIIDDVAHQASGALGWVMNQILCEMLKCIHALVRKAQCRDQIG